MPLEIELKLCAEPATLKRLMKSPAITALALGPARVQKLHSTYYDTPALDLTRAGIALRLRRVGRRHVLTLKTRGDSHAGLHARGEFEAPAPTGRLDLHALAGLDPATTALLADCADRLQPLFCTEFKRSALQLAMPGGGRAELAFDLGEIRAGDEVEALSEIEIELIEGQPVQIYALARSLLSLAPLKIGNRSKAERAFALLAPVKSEPIYAGAPALDAELPATQACGRMLASALVQLEANEEGILAGTDPEFLHQARVALRRMRALLRLFKPLLPEDEGTALRSRLRALCHSLGACRDWDVLCTQTLPQLHVGLLDPALLDTLAAAAEKRRVNALGEVRTSLDVSDYTDLKLATGALIARLLEPAHEAGDSLAEFAGNQLPRSVERVQRRHAELLPDSVEALHALRIEVKNLRYACDLLGGVYRPKQVRRYVKSLSRLQALLGGFNDAVVAGEKLKQLPKTGAYGRGLVDGYACAQISRTRQALPAAWEKFERAKHFW